MRKNTSKAMSWDFRLFRKFLKEAYKEKGYAFPEELHNIKNFSIIDAMNYGNSELVWEVVMEIVGDFAEFTNKKITHEFKRQVYAVIDADAEVRALPLEDDDEYAFKETGEHYYWYWVLDKNEINNIIDLWYNQGVRMWISAHPGDDSNLIDEYFYFYNLDLEQTATDKKEIKEFHAELPTEDMECEFTIYKKDIKPLEKAAEWIKKHYGIDPSVINKIIFEYKQNKPDFNNMVLDLYLSQYFMEVKERKRRDSKYGTRAVEEILESLGTSIKEVIKKADPEFKSYLIEHLKSKLESINKAKQISGLEESIE